MTAYNTMSNLVAHGKGEVDAPRRQGSKKKVIQCDIVFGAPSANCQGTGICKIVAREETVRRTRNCQNTQSLAAQGPGGEGITIFFFREFLCMNLMRLHFRHGKIIVSEPCRLPERLIRDLDLNISEVHPGSYRLEESFGYYRLDIYPPTSRKHQTYYHLNNKD